MIIPLAFVLTLSIVVLWSARPIMATITALQLFFIIHVGSNFGKIRNAMIASDVPTELATSQALYVSVMNALYAVIVLGLIILIIHVVKRIFYIRNEAKADVDKTFP
ncbi:hypothetical protein [Robiginitomaculum antarcticum]|uniref:hypothetical protein n=1 Tax=Robiginitomaculum antarcticum TaxID=437507 RepID=UPI00036D8DB2|nr:hypothetical protein [Robiginitomaculum antarcticum]